MATRVVAALALLVGVPAQAQVPAQVPLSAPAPLAATALKPTPKADPGPPKGVTPNAERDVSIGAINKRTGETRTFIGKPGQGFAFGSLNVQVRTCEITPPWEQKLTGAFLLIDERLVRGAPRRVFSGWMFAESPSLHPLEHPRYDIWVKSCTMRFPETGPDTVVAGRAETGPAPNRSKARKSAETPIAVAN